MFFIYQTLDPSNIPSALECERTLQHQQHKSGNKVESLLPRAI